MSPHSRTKALIFAAVVILTNTIGNFCIAWGMKHLGSEPTSVFEFLRVLFTPWVASGIVLLICWLLSRMMFLSFADLSYMLPITALGYVANALLGLAFLGEHITARRWGGTFLIVAGTLLVGSGSAHRSATDSNRGSAKP
ncbi:MAG: EamA family transporter [Bryobacteraceae bacterium]